MNGRINTYIKIMIFVLCTAIVPTQVQAWTFSSAFSTCVSSLSTHAKKISAGVVAFVAVASGIALWKKIAARNAAAEYKKQQDEKRKKELAQQIALAHQSRNDRLNAERQLHAERARHEQELDMVRQTHMHQIEHQQLALRQQEQAYHDLQQQLSFSVQNHAPLSAQIDRQQSAPAPQSTAHGVRYSPCDDERYMNFLQEYSLQLVEIQQFLHQAETSPSSERKNLNEAQHYITFLQTKRDERLQLRNQLSISPKTAQLDLNIMLNYTDPLDQRLYVQVKSLSSRLNQVKSPTLVESITNMASDAASSAMHATKKVAQHAKHSLS